MKTDEKHNENPQAPAAAAAETGGEKVPALDPGEDRLTPVAAEVRECPEGNGSDGSHESNVIGSINPGTPVDFKNPEAGGYAAIGAIAAAMDIDTRLAHALVDIHAGMDGAEAIARAYGVALPDRAAKGGSPDRDSAGTSSDAPAAGGPAVSRLPEGKASVPSFLSTPRRGFWE